MSPVPLQISTRSRIDNLPRIEKVPKTGQGFEDLLRVSGEIRLVVL